ncbi:ATP-binding protein [Streptomyces sp. NBC_01217]|uniref:ATP-binding protein n=1 Tax=Streptomyces sp. NBC_01217 TaxID=2903779 RepID=UPI002E0D9DF2|nr:ATP-binding protein [Streptomyces sp. NBC_01217]
MPYRTPALKSSVLRVPSDTAAVPEARRRVVAVVRGWCLPLAEDTVATLELLAGEVIANAVLHTRESCRVTVTWDGTRVRLEAEDAVRRPLPLPTSAPPDEEGGRGLQLVAGLAQAWGSRPTAYGKSVWFEVGDPSSSSARTSHNDHGVERRFEAAHQWLPGAGPVCKALTGFLPQTA